MLIFDGEFDGLLDELTVCHCLHILDRATGERMRFSSGVYADGTPAPRSGSVEDGLRLLIEAEDICGHNIIGFDLKAFKKLYPWFEPKGRIHDTLVYARLIWTNLREIDAQAIKKRIRPPGFTGEMVGAHSLEAWGFRLGVFKGDYKLVMEARAREAGITDEVAIARFVWGSFNREMDDYCEQDNEGCLALLEKIESKEYSPEALELEIEVAKIITAQEDHGFLFDVAKAEKLTAELCIRRAELADKLRATFRPWYEPERYKGAPVVFTPKRNDKKRGYMAGVPFTKIKQVVFNPGSRDQIANRMITLFGWAPTEFTPSGEPKVDEETLGTIQAPEAKLLVEYLTVDKRLSQMAEGDTAWLKMVKPDGRIHGRVNPMGAVTGRMTHFKPNYNIPKVKKGESGVLLGYEGGYGWECRSLFKVPEDRLQVGCDAEGLELRMLGHYMARFDGGAYIRSLIYGKKEDGTDAHTINQKLLQFNSRDNAKTWMYAYLYGSGAPNLGAIQYDDFTDQQKAAFNAKVRVAEERAKSAGQDHQEVRTRMLGGLGRAAKERIEAGLPALGSLLSLVKDKARRGYILGLDRRKIHIRSSHAALNSLLQGGGAVVMKKALVICDQKFKTRGWAHGREYAFVANVHDEFQIEVWPDIAEEVGRMAADSIREAGEHFDLRCPLAGAYDIGRNWAECH